MVAAVVLQAMQTDASWHYGVEGVDFVAKEADDETNACQVKSVSELIAAAYNPELATTLGTSMQDMLHSLEAAWVAQPRHHTGFSHWTAVTIILQKYKNMAAVTTCHGCVPTGLHSMYS